MIIFILTTIKPYFLFNYWHGHNSVWKSLCMENEINIPICFLSTVNSTACSIEIGGKKRMQCDLEHNWHNMWAKWANASPFEFNLTIFETNNNFDIIMENIFLVVYEMNYGYLFSALVCHWAQSHLDDEIVGRKRHTRVIYRFYLMAFRRRMGNDVQDNGSHVNRITYTRNSNFLSIECIIAFFPFPLSTISLYRRPFQLLLAIC